MFLTSRETCSLRLEALTASGVAGWVAVWAVVISSPFYIDVCLYLCTKKEFILHRAENSAPRAGSSHCGGTTSTGRSSHCQPSRLWSGSSCGERQLAAKAQPSLQCRRRTIQLTSRSSNSPFPSTGKGCADEWDRRSQTAPYSALRS